MHRGARHQGRGIRRATSEGEEPGARNQGLGISRRSCMGWACGAPMRACTGYDRYTIRTGYGRMRSGRGGPVRSKGRGGSYALWTGRTICALKGGTYALWTGRTTDRYTSRTGYDRYTTRRLLAGMLAPEARRLAAAAAAAAATAASTFRKQAHGYNLSGGMLCCHYLDRVDLGDQCPV
jgi:hypothetical protein